MKTIKQVAKELGIAPTTVYRWCKIFGFSQVGGSFYVLDADQIDRIRQRPDRRTGEWKNMSGTERHTT